MTPRAHKTVLDAAEWQVTLGWSTGVVFTLIRVFAIAAVALAEGPIELSIKAQVVIEAVLAAVLTYGVYRRRAAAAIALFALWAIGFVYAWATSGRLLPPLGLIGVLLGIGLFQGVRGTLALRALGRSGAPAA